MTAKCIAVFSSSTGVDELVNEPIFIDVVDIFYYLNNLQNVKRQKALDHTICAPTTRSML